MSNVHSFHTCYKSFTIEINIYLLNGLSWLYDCVFELLFFLIKSSTEKVQSFNLDLLIQVIHGLLDFKLLIEQYTESVNKKLQWNFRRWELFRWGFMFNIKYWYTIGVILSYLLNSFNRPFILLVIVIVSILRVAVFAIDGILFIARVRFCVSIILDD